MILQRGQRVQRVQRVQRGGPGVLSDKRWRRARTEATGVTECLAEKVAFFALRESAKYTLKSASND